MGNFDYYTYHIKSVTNKINQEIIFYENCEYKDVPFVKEYLSYLKNRIGLDKQIKNTSTKNNMGNYTIKKLDLNEYVKDMDILTFKKPWCKLREFHKLMKIREYVENLNYGKIGKKRIEENRRYIKEELCLGIKSKKFGKNKCEIIYDKESMSIKSISCLKFDSKTGLYKIDWDE